ncbi:hypothetical protein [Pantanalinema sp. GBBB05]|uniref:hypothetical protein n=1 Tax=Pantanalinema sp. GBBB05 TaxID=2604139 RepID=UPI001DEC6B03|nr:hypothetical protein [Pantanalinema sp. GBBB05]
MTNHCTSILNGHAPKTQQLFITPFMEIPDNANDFSSVRLHLDGVPPSELLVLEALCRRGQATGVDLQEETGLGNSTVLKAASSLRKKDVAVANFLPGTENKSSPTFVFSIHPDIPIDLVIAEVKRLKSASKPQGRKKKQSKEKKQSKGFAPPRQPNTNPATSRIYEILRNSPNGCTAKELVYKAGLSMGTVQGVLKRALDKEEVSRKKNLTNSTVEYIYTISDNVSNTDQIPDVLSAASSSVLRSPTTTHSLDQSNINSLISMEPSQQESPASPPETATQTSLWALVVNMAQRVLELESRFKQMEQAFQAIGKPEPEEVLSEISQRLRKKD